MMKIAQKETHYLQVVIQLIKFMKINQINNKLCYNVSKTIYQRLHKKKNNKIILWNNITLSNL